VVAAPVREWEDDHPETPTLKRAAIEYNLGRLSEDRVIAEPSKGPLNALAVRTNQDRLLAKSTRRLHRVPTLNFKTYIVGCGAFAPKNDPNTFLRLIFRFARE
jgi:hypothetical protein